jgi:hypothetical protein
MILDITERGNNAFSNEEGSAVLFAEIGPKGKYLQTAYNPMNYPSWDVSTIFLYNDELINHIMYNLDGWHVDKCQLDINTSDGYVVGAEYVVDEVANHVMNKAYDGDYDPTQTEGALYDAIIDSAAVLDYKLTQRMHQECYEIVMESFENNSN